MAHRAWNETREARRALMSATEREESGARVAGLASALRTGIAVRDAREAAGLTQTDLAVCMGVAQSAVSRIEAGRANVTVEMLTRIAVALGAPLKVTLGTCEAVLRVPLVLDGSRPAKRTDADVTEGNAPQRTRRALAKAAVGPVVAKRVRSPRRETPRIATPEELADENRRAEQARAISRAKAATKPRAQV